MSPSRVGQGAATVWPSTVDDQVGR